jgi:hypothetical protein
MIAVVPIIYICSVFSFYILNRNSNVYGPVIWGVILVPLFLFLVSRPELAGDDLLNYYSWMNYIQTIVSIEEVGANYPSPAFSLMLYVFSLIDDYIVAFDLFQFTLYFLVSIYLYIKGGARLVFLLLGLMFFTRIYLDFSSNAIRGSIAGLIFSLGFLSKYKITILAFLLLSIFIHWKQSVAVCFLILLSFIFCFFFKDKFENNKKTLSLILLMVVISRLYIPEVILSYLGALGGLVSSKDADYLRLEQIYSGELLNRWTLILQVITAAVIPYLLWIHLTVSDCIKDSIMKVFSFGSIVLYFIFIDVYAPVERLLMYAMPIIYIGLLKQYKHFKLSQIYFVMVLMPLNVYGLLSIYGY